MQPSFSHERLYRLLQCCGALPNVKEEVLRNHDDNRWWPLAIPDWRLRFIIAGWSTRISYRMISTYQKVIAQANEIGYDQLCGMTDTAIEQVVASLGLVRARRSYFRSVQQYLQRGQLSLDMLNTINNDTLIEQFVTNVAGAGYKVAQCAVLYAKGYHCGIFPVDSGMKDMLGPCFGLQLPHTPLAHEIMRKQVEEVLQSHASSYLRLAHELGYESLSFPPDRAPVWWAHLTLIYFKRCYCNAHQPHTCPLRLEPNIGLSIGTMCDRFQPQPGGLHDDESATTQAPIGQ